MNRLLERGLRIVEFNVENLFVFLDLHAEGNVAELDEKTWQRLSTSTIRNKPLLQVRQIARAIREMDPDILMLCEVGGHEGISNFAKHFLDDQYIPFLMEGNSDRGIDLGYLVHRRLGVRAEMISHKEKPIDFLYPHERLSKESGYDHLRSARRTSHRFSRDVLELRLFDGSESKPSMVLMLVHLKSQLDRSGIDPQGRDRRRAELQTLVKIYGQIRKEVGEDVPILLGGDFNGVAARKGTDPEFEALYRDTDLEDCLEVAGVPDDERFTHMQIYSKKVGYNKQIDYLFVSRQLHESIDRSETWVYRYKDDNGRTLLIPRNLGEKRMLPSDHYPIILTLKPRSRNDVR